MHQFLRRRRSWLSAFASLATGFAALAQSDITQPGDQVIASSANSPGSEGVANIIDNKPTKYLNFDGKNNQPSGFTVKPSIGRTLVTGLTVQSANDAPDRDPATYELSGSDDGTTFTVISSGDVPEFGADRFKTVSLSFANTSAYLWYKLTFPTTRGASTCCMQVAEVELLGTAIKDDVTQPSDVIVASSANSPGSEGAANVIDNKPTKYLNFDGKNNTPSGFTVTPGVGATVVTGLSVQSANDAPDRDPMTYVLSGSNDGTTFTPISSGDVPEFGTARFKTVYTLFANTKAYKTYMVTFPTTRGNSTCCMQVAEVELLGDVAPQDVTIPGDPTVATSANSPGSEGVANVIDNKPTKYLNFDGKNNQPSGFTVTPSAGKSIVTGLTIQSANDGPERDPATYELSGSNDGTTFTPISSGDVPDFGADRFKTVEISFANAVAYSSYRLIFPTTRGNSTCCMQVAEVEFLGFVFDPTKFPKFLTKPSNTPALTGAKARFFVTLDGPWRLQWYKNGTAIPGANQLAYETDTVTANSGNDTYYAIAKNGPLETQSDTVKVQVFTPSVTKSIGLNFVGGGANGAPTRIEPTDIAGAHQQAYWNNFPRTTEETDAGILVKNSGNEDTDIIVEFAPTGQWGTGTGNDSGDRKILNGYLSGADGGNTVEVTFNNVPSGNHSILVYAINRPLAFNDSDYRVEGLTTTPTISIRAQNADEYNAAPGFVRGTSTDPTKRSVANFIRFDNIKPDASGIIKLVAQGLPEPGESPAGAAPINAVQLLLNPPAAIDPPVVTTQPSSQNLVVGAPATFTVAANGANKKYQWRKGNNTLSDGGKISGSATESLTIANAEASDEGVYSVTVSNDGGSVNSAAAVLSLYNGKIADRLAAHWRFDEKAGFKAANSVAGGQAGDLQGYSDNSSWVAGRVGGALSFDGASQFVIVPDYTKPTTAEAISAWVWTDASQASTIIANSGKNNDQGLRLSQFELGLATEGDLTGRIVAGPNAYIGREGSDKALSTGEWHHIVLTADGARLTIYRDGAVVSALDYAGRITDPTAACIGIGGLLDNTIDPNDPEDKACVKVIEASPSLWTGKLDDMAFWTRPLGADEVAAIYNLGKSGKSLSEVPDVAPPVTTPPALSVKANADGTITVTFEGKLEVATDAAGPYVLLDTPSPLTFAPNAAMQFARARR